MARCARCCCRGRSRTSASTCLIRGSASGSTRWRCAGPAQRGFASILGIKEYPDASRAGLLDALLRVPHEMVITESFAPIERQTARERIDLALRRLRSADEGAATERAEMLAARDAVGAGPAELRRSSPEPAGARAARSKRSRARRPHAAAALADIGAVAVREDVNLEPAFWGQFPGNEQYVVRRALISSANAAGFISLHGFPMGRARRQPLGRGGHACFETTSATPYFFNFHEGDLGNFTIIGPSGSGKTVVLNFLAAQAQKFTPAHDPVRQGPGLRDVRARARRALRADHARRADRLQSAAPARQRRSTAPSCATGCACCSKPKGAEEETAIAKAVDEIYAHGPELRRLRFSATARRGPPPAAGRSCRRGSIPGSSTASTPGCSTIEDDKLDFETACSAST